jgi:LysR family transcriptional regulator, cell division regulator
MNINTYPNPTDLRYFQEMAQSGNLSRAAERLGVGQPALSLSLKRLEGNLEVKLFLRRNRGLALTPAGQRLLRESNRLLSVWESVVSETKKSETELIGRFTLGCHPSVALYAFSTVVRDIYVSFPGIEIQMVHGLSRVICEGVISGAIDFGIAVNPIRHPDLVISELVKDEFTFWKTPRGLVDVLLYNPDFVQSQSLLKKLNHVFKRTVISDSLEVLSVMARSGAGTALLPERVVKVMAPELRKVEGSPSFQDRVTLIYRSDFLKTASSKAVLGKLKNISI